MNGDNATPGTPNLHIDQGVELSSAAKLSDLLAALNAADPVTIYPMYFQLRVSHLCLDGEVRDLDLTEKYVLEEADPPRAALIYREGQCPICHTKARSRVGRVVDPAKRPPLEATPSSGR